MSQKLTFEQLRRGAQQDLAECLKMENRMVGWAIVLGYMNKPCGHLAGDVRYFHLTPALQLL